MLKLEFMRKFSKSALLAFRQPVVFKVLVAISAILLLVFADTTIPLINSIILLKINLLGLFLEPLLQSIFDIPLRQAQVVASWIYLLIGVFIVWYVFKKVYQELIDALFTIRQFWLSKNRKQKIGCSAFILLMLIALTKAALFFV